MDCPISAKNKPRGVFINQKPAQCSIFESGRMIYSCLKNSEKYDIDYVEIGEGDVNTLPRYDFYAFNYHPYTMPWMDFDAVRKLPGLKLTFVLEVLPNDPFALCPPDKFDVYCPLDPTVVHPSRDVYPFPRPLEVASDLPVGEESEIPVIGSFGFATPGKGFELVVQAVNDEFDQAHVRINIPAGTFADDVCWKMFRRNYAEYLAELCQKVAKPGVTVEVTHTFMDKKRLIDWCSRNTLNCFLYSRFQPGLSATTDQAITSGRPLAVSTNETFRHIHAYLTPYPYRSLRESILFSRPEVARMRANWTPARFQTRFEQVLADRGLLDAGEAEFVLADSRRPVVLFISHKQRRCGIHEYGVNIFRALRKSKKFQFVYAECDCIQSLENAVLASNPALIIYNYYPFTMPWLTAETTKRYHVPQLEIMHEVTQEAADAATTEFFDYHLCPDPTLVERNPAIFKTKRLIPPFLNSHRLPETVTIGSFGFGFKDKGFPFLVNKVQEEFDEAVIRLHMPYNDLVPSTGAFNILDTAEECRKIVHKPGISLEIDHQFWEQDQLLNFLAENTMNAFFYDTNKVLGISSTVEWALAAQRPLALNMCGMFRHMHGVKEQICIEYTDLHSIIERGIAPLVPYYNQWDEAHFIMDYERILESVIIKGGRRG